MDQIQKLPKVDLHCHLDGSLHMEFLRSVSGLSSEELIDAAQVKNKECNNLSEYLKKFVLPISCLMPADNVREASDMFIKSLVPDNVKYVEVRFSPALLESEELHARDIIECVISGLERGYQDYSIRSNVIICAMRHYPAEKNMRIFKLAKEYLGHGVCAVDLAGNEAKFPMYLFRDLFSFAKCEKIPFTIHAGECGNSENIREAIELGARRIGHGIAMRGDTKLQTLCRDRHIGVEMCPISNFQTTAVKSFDDYPIWEFINNRLQVTINTDNRTVSNTTLWKEFSLLHMHYGLMHDDFVSLTQNAVECSFANDSIKQELIKLCS